MSQDPILAKLDEILGRHFPAGALDPVTAELRALLVVVELTTLAREHDMEFGEQPPKALADVQRQEAEKRFGVASEGDDPDRICSVCGKPYARSGPGPDKSSSMQVAFRHADGRLCVTKP